MNSRAAEIPVCLLSFLLLIGLYILAHDAPSFSCVAVPHPKARSLSPPPWLVIVSGRQISLECDVELVFG